MTISISARIRYAMLSLVVLLGLMFSSLMFLLVYVIEDKIFINQIEVENQAYMESYYAPNWSPVNQNIKRYFSFDELPSFFPESFKKSINFEKGIYEYFDDSKAMFVLYYPATDNVDSYLLSYDVSDFIAVRENKKNIFLLIFVVTVLIIGVSIILSRYLAKKTLSPLRQLTNSLQALDENQSAVDLAYKFYPDEIGVLAKELGFALDRLSESAKREFEFNQSVSHELRTPIQSAKSALELLLLSHQEEGSRNAKYLDRLTRAVNEMSQTAEAFLWLSNTNNRSENNMCSISNVILELNDIEDIKMQVERNENLADTHCYRAPEAVLRIIIRNLIRNAISHGCKEAVIVRLSEKKMSITNRYEVSKVSSSGWGLGLTIIKRLCERFQCEFIITDDGSTFSAEIIMV